MSLALQKAIRETLIADASVAALVLPTSIVDRSGKPEIFPCIILGETQEVTEDLTLARNHVRQFVTLHVWTREASTIGVQQLASAVRRALQGITPALEWGIAVDFSFESTRIMRDPSNEHAHAVLVFSALIEEAV